LNGLIKFHSEKKKYKKGWCGSYHQVPIWIKNFYKKGAAFMCSGKAHKKTSVYKKNNDWKLVNKVTTCWCRTRHLLPVDLNGDNKQDMVCTHPPSYVPAKSKGLGWDWNKHVKIENKCTAKGSWYVFRDMNGDKKADQVCI
jgi:hypothetical protein